jgi:SAM-dependent methyltransferase
MSLISPLKIIVKSLFPGLQSFPGKMRGILPFIMTYREYRKVARVNKQLKPTLPDLFPQFDDRYKESGNAEQHYFLQDLWAARLIYASRPEVHYDVGSRIDGFVAHVSIFCKTKVIDIRPQSLDVKNIEFMEGDICDLPFEDNSLASLSCLHAAEHIGLGRYGDDIDPLGTQKAAKELQRVLNKGGDLYFALPVGRERICFNAHRVFAPETILQYFNELKLESFSLIDDTENFTENVAIDRAKGLEYGCGLFHFKKRQ